MPNPWTGKGNPYTRKEVIERLNATLKRREPIIAAGAGTGIDRKSTRLNSSHSQISYAVFCLKKNERPENVPSMANPHHLVLEGSFWRRRCRSFSCYRRRPTSASGFQNSDD